MGVLRSLRSWLVPMARWLAPSAVAACAGTLIAGAFEGVGTNGLLGVAITAGFVALLAVPALFAASVLVRGIHAAWQPRLLTYQILEDGGSAPRLAGWVAVVGLGALVLALAVYRGTWMLAARTAFKPMITSFVEPIIAVGTALLLVSASRPAARLFAALCRRIDARWRRSGRRTLLRPRAIFLGAAVSSFGLVYATWRVVVQPRLGPIDTSLLYAPGLALATTLVVHALWSRLGRARLIVGATIGLFSGATITLALVARSTWPSTTLEIWGDRPLAGVAIERMFDLESIRANVSLETFRPAPQPGARHPDIVLVTIDTVRADHTPPYGGDADMPFLRGLGERGTVFDWAFAPSNVTRRSIPSMVIGLAPTRIRGRVVGWALRVDPRHVFVAERLQAGGYETAGFMCCGGFWGESARTGLGRGLEHIEIERDGTKLAHLAADWLQRREAAKPQQPLFLWMHILEPHNWNEGVGEPHDLAARQKLYDKSLAASDAMVAEVISAFRHRSPDQMPIVIVTADHGEALGEHNQPNHSTDLYNSQIRVPFVIAGPGITPRHIDETVSLTDLTPTLVELAGFAPPRGPDIDGASVADLATGRRASKPDAGTAFSAMIKDRSNPGGMASIVEGKWKLISIGERFELFDLHADPSERVDLASSNISVVREMREHLLARQLAAELSPFSP